LKKGVEAEADICGKLRLEAVGGLRRLQFLLLEYRFFRDSEEGGALPLSLPRILTPLSLTLHVVKSRALTLLRLPCFFLRLDKRVVGLWAVQERQEGLVVASLGVAREYRRLGIGTCILCYVEAIANRLGKRWLETLVLTRNIPAQRIYSKFGFAVVRKGRTHCIMRKEIIKAR
jgi:ribosomal protein S18 acetylase RimI-like enzyme